MRLENIIYNTFVTDKFVLSIWSPGWRNDEDRWLGRGWQNEVFRVLQTDGASSAGHREKVSKRGDNVIGAEIINMVELDNHDPKNQKVWFFNFEKVAAPPSVLPRPTTKDLWSRVGLFCILLSTSPTIRVISYHPYYKNHTKPGWPHRHCRLWR